MSVSSISFWQQDQNYWSNVKTEDQSQSQTNSLITAMSSLETNKVKGLASIANQEALTRTNNALTAALQSAIATTSGTSSTGSSASTTPPSPIAATGTGTVPLTAGTSLLTLGIPPQGTVTVSDGTNTTTYTSTGTDTVADLLNAINTSGPKNAQATAWLDSSGHLVVAAQNNTDTISVAGDFASDVGFGASNDSFAPTTPASTASSSSSASTSSTSSSSSATSSSGSSTASATSNAVLFNSSPELQVSSATATLLSSGISSGSVINLLA